jgi:hypothetical protein
VRIGSTNTRVMKLYSSWRFTRCASLLTTGTLLCLGAFLLSWPRSGSEVSTDFSVADASHAEQVANGQGANGYGHRIDDYYLAVYAEDDEAGQQLPKNAALLRALVFVLYIGLALGWLVVSGWRRCKPEVCSLIRGWFHSMVHLHQRRAIATLLGVFLL